VTVYGTDLSHHNGSIDWDALDALSDVHLVTHKITEGTGYIDPAAAGRAAQVKRFAAAGFYHVLWPTNSQGNPQNQAKFFMDQIARLAPWMFTHPCPVAQGDFELFSNFVPYRPPTISECNAFNKWVLYYWRQHTDRPLYQPNYAPFWLYGNTLTGLAGDLWASSYVGGSGSYRALYPGDDGRRWTQIPSKPARILQYSSLADFGSAAQNVDGNGVRGVSTPTELQQLLLGGEPDMPLSAADVNLIWDEPIENTLVKDGLSEAARTRLLKAQAYANDAQATAAAALAKATQVEAALASLHVTLTPEDITAIATQVIAGVPTSGTAPSLAEITQSFTNVVNGTRLATP
jgi:hypothetical protein